MSRNIKDKKEALLKTITDFRNTYEYTLRISYIPNITRDFLNEAKPRHIQSFFMEMSAVNVKETLIHANDDHLEKVIDAIYENKKIVSRLKNSLVF